MSQRSAQGKPSVDHADIPQEEQLRILRKLFNRFYEETVEEGSFLFPDVAETLSALHANGIPLGLVTNKPTPLSPLCWKRWISRSIFPSLLAVMMCRTKAASGTVTAGGRKIILNARGAALCRGFPQ